MGGRGAPRADRGCRIPARAATGLRLAALACRPRARLVRQSALTSGRREYGGQLTVSTARSTAFSTMSRPAWTAPIAWVPTLDITRFTRATGDWRFAEDFFAEDFF